MANKDDPSLTTLPQFGISAMLWATFVVALGLGYLRRFDSMMVFTAAGGAFFLALFVGVMIGWPVRRIGSATYWAVVIGAAAFFSVAGEHAAPAAFRFAWTTVGILSGACCGAIAPQRLVQRMLAGAIAAGFTMGLTSTQMPDHDLEWMFDLLCAPIIGALVGMLIELIHWLELQRYAPRYVTASWLLSAVIIGNLLVPLALG